MPGEDLQLSKGSKKALQDKRLVSEIARELKDQSKLNPSVFPAGTYRTFRNMADQQVAEWFFSEIDKLEKAGYNGIKFSQDGSNNDWLARKFINGGHSWEDIIGKFPQQMYNWFLLKRYNRLEPRHVNVPAYSGLHELGNVMVRYYGDTLKSLEDESKYEQIRKNAKSLIVVDNDDYRIYTTLNRAANQIIGRGTVWCTTSIAPPEQPSTMFDTYADQAMVFQLFPKDAQDVSIEKVGRDKLITGKEKYQFGADRGYSFMNLGDIPVPKEEIQERFPYLYDDLTTALRAMKPEFDRLTKELSEDPTLNKIPALKIKVYNIDQEIQKLKGFVDNGKFSTQKRPAAIENPEQPPEPNQPSPSSPQNESWSYNDDRHNLIIKEEKMSNVDKDIAAMLNSLKKYDHLAKKTVLKESSMPEVDEMFDYSNPKSPRPTRPTHDELARRQVHADFEKSRGNSLMRTYGDEYKDRFKYGDFHDIAGPKGVLPEDDMPEVDEMFDYSNPKSPRPTRPTHDELARRQVHADFEKSRGNSLMRTYGDEYKDRFKYGDFHDIAGPKGVLPEDELEEDNQPDQDVMEWMDRFRRLGKI